MTDARTRSEYRLRLDGAEFEPDVPGLTNLDRADRAALAQLMLDAYRGSVDDEGETFDEALDAIDHYVAHAIGAHSFVLEQAGKPVAMSLVSVVDGVHYIDPVAVTAGHKGRGLGRRMVVASLASLVAAGVDEVGAAITDGNVPSERLFAGLGFERIGPWPPAAA